MSRPFSADHQRHFPTRKKTSNFFIIWFIFHDFSALTNSTNIFRFGGKITVLTSQNLGSENFKRLENEVYLSWFFNLTRLRKSFSIFRRDQSPPFPTLKSVLIFALWSLIQELSRKNCQIFDKPLTPPLKSDKFYFSIFLFSRWNSLSVQNFRFGRPQVQILVIKDRVLLMSNGQAWLIGAFLSTRNFSIQFWPQSLHRFFPHRVVFSLHSTLCWPWTKRIS